MFVLYLALALQAGAPLPPPGRKAEASAPFSFYLVPSDEIGFKDCPQAFQITFDGAVNSGYGELDLFAGSKLSPVNERVKTLVDGCLPVVQYGFVRDGVRYDVEAFAATPDFDPREDLVAFERVRMSNPGREPIEASLRAAYNPRASRGRANLPPRKWYAAQFIGSGGDPVPQPGSFFKDGNFVLAYSGTPQVDDGARSATYRFSLAPGEGRTVEFRMPVVPVSSNRLDLISRVSGLSFDDYFKRTAAFWRGIYAQALQIDVDDPKVVQTMRAGLTYDLMARDIERDGVHFTQTVNKFQYHAFFARDTSFIARSYEMLNLPEIARQTIEKYLVRDSTGKVVKFLRTSPDDWGQSLWAVGAYYRATGDDAFAREVDSAIGPHLDEFEKSVKSDPLGLWPVAGPYDNELINGHYTSHNLWALLGLREAANLAKGAGDLQNANRADTLYEQFDRVFMDRLAVLTAKDDGYIPPGMDDPLAGYDWENASGGVYPFRVLPPDNEWVKATIDMEREYKYREGIMTWGPNAWAGKVAAETGKAYDPLYLHDYDTFQVAETELARGEQQKVVEDLYSTLVHTSSTQAGFETSIRPWGNRDPDDNFPPHGWFAARYNELLRNMLLREDGDDLHLCSALAPQWVRPGKSVRVVNGTTDFGGLDFVLTARAHGAELTLDPHWRTAPKRILLHLPWFVRASGATVDGAAAKVMDGVVELSPTARKVEIAWRWTSHPNLSYDRAVTLWLQKAYDPKPGEDIDHLFPTKTRPAVADPRTTFLDSYMLRLVSRSHLGVVHFTLDGSAPSATSPIFTRPMRVTESAVVRAVEVYSDGSLSDPIEVRLTKAKLIAPVSVVSPSSDASYNYFEGSFDSMPDFAKLTPTRSGLVSSVDLESVIHRPEVFAFTFEGLLKVPSDGLYGFATGSDDGSTLSIDGELVVDNGGPHAYKEAEGLIALKAGFHRVRIEYFDAGGANSLHVFWTLPGKSEQRIPAGSWFHEAATR